MVAGSAPERLRKGLPRHPIPVILLARLAVDQNFKGRGLGAGLLKNALLRVLNASRKVGVRAFIVNAKDDAARRFYEHFNFEGFPEDSRRLFLLIKDLRKSIMSLRPGYGRLVLRVLCVLCGELGYCFGIF